MKKQSDFLTVIKKKQEQKLRAKKRGKNWVFWVGVSVFGLIGWSVMVPVLIGLALGIWIDKTWITPISWTLILGLGGLIAGCISAWFWLVKERKEIEREKNDRK